MATTPRLPLRQDPRSAAFAWCADRIAARLRSRIKDVLVLLPDNEQFSGGLPDGRTAVRLTPTLDPSKRVATRGSTGVAMSPVRIKVETRVPGYLWENSANVWGEIEAALLPGDPAKRLAADAAARAHGVADVVVAQPAASPDPMKVAEGEIVLSVFVNA